MTYRYVLSGKTLTQSINQLKDKWQSWCYMWWKYCRVPVLYGTILCWVEKVIMIRDMLPVLFCLDPSGVSCTVLSDTVVWFLVSDTHTHPFYGRLDFVHDYRGEPVPETIWILLMQETVSGSDVSWAICKSAPCCRQITKPACHHSVFYRLNACKNDMLTLVSFSHFSVIRTRNLNGCVYIV